MPNKKYLTTGQAAKICRVSQRTVIRWIDSEQLKGHRFPGTGAHRRIMEADLLGFLRKNGIPVPSGLESRKKRVLIVEDEAIVSFLMEEVLQGAGYETKVADNGFMAGQLLESFEPDIMTLDLNMPGVPGLKVLAALRGSEKFPRIGILVVSGTPQEKLDEAMAKGADGVLPKPFLNSALLECVDGLCGLSFSEEKTSSGG
jgi:two-component system, OmpR family, response regulator VicR